MRSKERQTHSFSKSTLSDVPAPVPFSPVGPLPDGTVFTKNLLFEIQPDGSIICMWDNTPTHNYALEINLPDPIELHQQQTDSTNSFDLSWKKPPSSNKRQQSYLTGFENDILYVDPPLIWNQTRFTLPVLPEMKQDVLFPLPAAKQDNKTVASLSNNGKQTKSEKLRDMVHHYADDRHRGFEASHTFTERHSLLPDKKVLLPPSETDLPEIERELSSLFAADIFCYSQELSESPDWRHQYNLAALEQPHIKNAQYNVSALFEKAWPQLWFTTHEESQTVPRSPQQLHEAEVRGNIVHQLDDVLSLVKELQTGRKLEDVFPTLKEKELIPYRNAIEGFEFPIEWTQEYIAEACVSIWDKIKREAIFVPPSTNPFITGEGFFKRSDDIQLVQENEDIRNHVMNLIEARQKGYSAMNDSDTRILEYNPHARTLRKLDLICSLRHLKTIITVELDSFTFIPESDQQPLQVEIHDTKTSTYAVKHPFHRWKLFLQGSAMRHIGQAFAINHVMKREITWEGDNRRGFGDPYVMKIFRDFSCSPQIEFAFKRYTHSPPELYTVEDNDNFWRVLYLTAAYRYSTQYAHTQNKQIDVLM